MFGVMKWMRRKACGLDCSCSSLTVDGCGCGRQFERLKRDGEVWYRTWAEDGDSSNDKVGNERERELSS